MAQKLIIDADPGIGDALAILAAMADPAIDVIALTGTAGCVSGQQATRNLHYLVGLVDPLRHPRIGQSDNADSPADHIPPGMPHQALLHGKFGLGDVEPLVPDLHNRRESARLIVDVVREHPHDVRIVTLGPLTNIAMAFDLDPELPVLLNGLICLGGTLLSIGDASPSAEFNFWCHPQAARAVMKSPVGKILVPLEVSQGPGLTFDHVDRLAGLIPSTPIGEFVNQLMLYAVRACRQQMPCEEVALAAATALAIASGASPFETSHVVADVETSGELTSGMLVIDRRQFQHRQTNAEIVTQVDDGAVVDYFCRGLRRIAISSDGRTP